MAQESDSLERIAADLLIAAMENNSNVQVRNSMANPEDLPGHYQKVFNAVYGARTNVVDDD